MSHLTKRQIAALRELTEDGYRVNWRPQLSRRGYAQLLDLGLIETAWTWASATRPDVRRTETGTAAIAAEGLEAAALRKDAA